MQEMGSAHQNSSIREMPWLFRLAEARCPPGPHFFVTSDIFNVLIAISTISHPTPWLCCISFHFIRGINFWIAWQRLCHIKIRNWISLLVVFAIIAWVDCLPFLDFLFLVLLLNFSPLVLHGRHSCCYPGGKCSSAAYSKHSRANIHR